jgi:hypothetical protein
MRWGSTVMDINDNYNNNEDTTKEDTTKDDDASSNNYLDWANTSYFSNNPRTNPAFAGWTFVYGRYCDGSSFSGRRIDPIHEENTNNTQTNNVTQQQSPLLLYFRGNYILEAIVNDFFSSSSNFDGDKTYDDNEEEEEEDDDDVDKGAKNNTNLSHVVIAGSSAGGLATYLHAHQIIDWIDQAVYDVHDSNNNNSNNYDHGIEIGLFVDSGFFRDWDESPIVSTTVDNNITNNLTSYSDWMKSIYILNNATDTLPTDCLLVQQNQQEYYRCMFAENVIPFLTVPYFAIQSKFDKWQLQHELLSLDDYNNWIEEEEKGDIDVDIINYANGLEHDLIHAFDWRHQQLKQQRGVGQQATNNGLFLHGCLLHSIYKLESCYANIFIDDNSGNISGNDNDGDSGGISIPRRSSSHVNIAIANWIESWIHNERRISPPIILVTTDEVPIDASDVRCCGNGN